MHTPTHPAILSNQQRLNSSPLIHVEPPGDLAARVAELEQQVKELETWKGKAKQILGYLKFACITHNWPKQSKAIEELFTPAAPDSG